MSETQPTYTYQNLAVTKTYSLTMLHIGMVSNLAQRLGISQGEVVRRAIELLYKQVEVDDSGNAIS